jgi:hypothetical protein
MRMPHNAFRTTFMTRQIALAIILAAVMVATIGVASNHAGAASLINEGIVDVDAALQDEQVDPIGQAREQSVFEFEAMERAPGLYTIPEPPEFDFDTMERAPGLYTIPEQPVFDVDAMERAPGIYTFEEQESLDFDAMERAPGLYTDSDDGLYSENEDGSESDRSTEDYVTLFDIMKRTPGVSVE